MENLTESTTNTLSDFFESTTDSIDIQSTIIAGVEKVINELLNGTNTKIVKEEETPSSYKPHLTLYDVLIPSIGALILILNLLVVISSGLILKKGQQPRSTYMFLGNVALTDFVTGLAVLFGQFYPKNIRNHYVCATQLGMIVSSTLASVYSVGLIAIDRYLFILHGLQYQIWVYPTRVRIFILASWIIGGILGFLPLMGWHGDTDNGRVCWFIFLAPKELILLTVIIGSIPILTVIVLYSIILYRAIKKIIQLKEADKGTATESGLRIFRGKGSVLNAPNVEDNSSIRASGNKKSQSPLNTPSKWKAIKVVMFTTGSFVITWSPYFIASLIYSYNCYEKHNSSCNTLRILIASPLAILGFANSLINPVIYAWWHKGFRTFIKEKFETIKLKKKLTREITAPSSSGSKSTSTGDTALGSRASSSTNLSTVPLETESYNLNTRM
ncbi:hypothetical protein ILUMI_01431 [Ignelater luminosus]|uniref:G-protein coupled receptors family 1 profile domain-containing protein n=1 Tax=Ignelater luminosus TaxID=2038154 RepID=A0A8K0DKA9_IGNLU|nr:hypothetical protein ILUMI_01431 [Ignelater luminosus]